MEYITVLRAIAILAVLTVHVNLLTPRGQSLGPTFELLISNGARGVQLFYLLSAFTLFLSFNNRSATEKKPIRNYFIRRFFRIAPLYYVAILYYLWQDGTGPRYWLGDAKGISTANIASNFLFVHGFSPYWINSVVPGGWSVAVEVLFYSLLPFLFTRIKNIQQACIFTIIALVLRIVMVRFLFHYPLIADKDLWSNYLFLFLPNQLPIFGLGIILYFIIYDNQKIKFSFKFLFVIAVCTITALAVKPDLFVFEAFYFGAGFLLLAYALHRYHPVVLFNRFFLYVGKVSYTLYLTHFAVVFLLTRFNLANFIRIDNPATAPLNYMLNYIIVLSLSVAVSTVLYYTVEEPMQRVGKRLLRIVNN
ncbi:acyltransferase [Mucilaginibacter xinganensis]|uniref:Acyltransferase n=1 Tax=Mucilaginibacter xinganensis TaxID=1234841 RepID=A0A223NTP1_9SPHI|nr:acyltransferase [Mucilaginibacter xinganensis]